MPGRAIDMTGRIYGRLKVVSRSGASKSGNAKWLCKCSCGRSTVVEGVELRKGATKSCGCLRREKPIKHGLHGTHTYRCWASMKTRCTNVNHGSFAKYGAKGITLCEEWKTFEGFLSDMGKAPSNLHTLDRIDGNKGYFPGNVRWATAKEQNANRKNSRLITYKGQSLPGDAWDRIVRHPRNTMYTRVVVNGWPVSKALNTPVKRSK